MLRITLFLLAILLSQITCSGENNVEVNQDSVEASPTDPADSSKIGDWDTPPQLLYRPTYQGEYNNEGNVLLRINTFVDGTVDTVWIQESSTHAELDSIALTQARQMVFKPATKEGKPIPAQFYFPMSFRLR